MSDVNSRSKSLEDFLVDVEPIIHGKWMKVTRDGMYWYACSHCTKGVPKDHYGHDYFSRRCPECGAHMTFESEATDE